MVVDDYPKEDSKNIAADGSEQVGGPAVRALMTVAKLGFDATLISAIGDDDAGRAILRELDAANVNTSEVLISRHSRTRRNHAWLSKKTGSRTIVYDSNGPDLGGLSPEARESVQTASALHLDGREPTAALEAALIAKRLGVPVTLDVGSPKRDLEALIAAASHVIIPRQTLNDLTGRRHVTSGAEKLLTYGELQCVVVTEGKDGSTGFAKGAGSWRVPAHPINVVDSNGAGDVYAGGFIWGMLRGFRIERCMRLAAVCAAIKCSRLGNDGLPTPEEVARMGDARG
jgi:ribokinase